MTRLLKDFNATPLGVAKLACDLSVFQILGLATAAILVAGVAIHAVVDVSADTLVFAISPGFRVTVRALEHTVIIRIGVADRADTIGIAVIGVEPGMVESCAQPAGRGVTRCASRRETRRHVIRIGRAAIVHLVASVTIRGQGRVVVVHVTTGACDRGVRPGQRERSVVMVERRRHPGRGAVAHVTLLRESDRYVVRVGCTLEICQVTRYARCIGQAIISVGVALTALQRRMGPGQRKAGGGVVERCRGPGGCVVTDLALLRESRRHVVRIGRAPVVRLVASVTSGGQSGVVAVHMTTRTGDRGVRTRQRERRAVVVERRRHPGRRAVAHLTLLRESDGYVVWIVGPLEVLQVARHARGGRQVVVAVHMALSALHRDVRSS